MKSSGGFDLSYQDQLIAFKNKYAIPMAVVPIRGDKLLHDFKMGHLYEELNELSNAYEDNDVEEMADALVDLVYVAIGYAVELGYNFDALWQEVHKANMNKIRTGVKADSKRGSTYDIIKPEGWTPPDTSVIYNNMYEDTSDPILKRAHDIIDNRTEEKERQYGSMQENCEHAAQIASIMQNKEFTPQDIPVILAALKLARHRRSYKQDSLLDAVAYLGALDNMINENGDERYE